MCLSSIKAYDTPASVVVVGGASGLIIINYPYMDKVKPFILPVGDYQLATSH